MLRAAKINLMPLPLIARAPRPAASGASTTTPDCVVRPGRALFPESDQTPGHRLARIRRERGKLRLQPTGPRDSKITSRKVLRPPVHIAALHPTQQTVLARTIDTFVEGAAAQTARSACGLT